MTQDGRQRFLILEGEASQTRGYPVNVKIMRSASSEDPEVRQKEIEPSERLRRRSCADVTSVKNARAHRRSLAVIDGLGEPLVEYALGSLPSPTRSSTRGRPWQLKRKRSVERLQSQFLPNASGEKHQPTISANTPSASPHSPGTMTDSQRAEQLSKSLEELLAEYEASKFEKCAKRKARVTQRSVLLFDISKADMFDQVLFGFCVTCVVVTVIGIIAGSLSCH
mmetsp:Transcript_24526/g.49002  ORF Transcript_24526/g.49002 Transcript_24526/m.49002 type:complete len:224 (-) Transcript_24526:64-735(-)